MKLATELSESEIKQEGSIPSEGAAIGIISSRSEAASRTEHLPPNEDCSGQRIPTQSLPGSGSRSHEANLESASDNSHLMYFMSPEFDAWLTRQFGRDIRLSRLKRDTSD